MDTILAHSRPNQQAIFESLIEPLSELLKESPGQNDFFRSIEHFQLEPTLKTPSYNCFQNSSRPGIFGINFTSRRTALKHRSKQPELLHVLFTLFVIYTSHCFFGMKFFL